MYIWSEGDLGVAALVGITWMMRHAAFALRAYRRLRNHNTLMKDMPALPDTEQLRSGIAQTGNEAPERILDKLESLRQSGAGKHLDDAEWALLSLRLC